MKRIRNIHFIGIGGIGMCGIAEVMLNQGYRVTGSDVAQGENVARLMELGAEIMIGHSADNVGDADVVVISSAINDENPELIHAHQLDIPVVPRAEMLSELMRKKNGIAISGTHGKTTTTSMIANMLDHAGMSPTYVIGGRLLKNDKNASLGESEYFIAEADESDGSFLLFHPMISVVTNIDNDHLSVYHDSMDELIAAFRQFISDIPFYGCAVLCVEDRHIVDLLPDVHRRVLTYGFGPDATVYCSEMTQTESGVDMHVVSEAYAIDANVRISQFGRHNALNALACICIGLELDIEFQQISSSLSSFAGISRRFNTTDIHMSEGRQVTVIDDYGHHPTEMMNVIDTAKSVYVGRRILFVFEPHRYSRVKSLFDGFVEALFKADYQLLLPIYAASETETHGVSSSVICDSLRSLGAADAHTVTDKDALFSVLQRIARDRDVVLFMGAGSVGRMARDFIDEVSA